MPDLAHEPRVLCALPVLDEEARVGDCLDALAAQTHPRIEIVVADGGSTDGTAERISARARTDGRIRRIENPGRTAAAGFARAMEASDAPLVLIVGARARLGPDYVARAVDRLAERGDASAVGGVPRPDGRGPVAASIACALRSAAGASSRRFTEGGPAVREVRTVSYAVYRRTAIEDVGGFDESLGRAQDVDLNLRLGDAGHRLLQDRELEATYLPRRSLRDLLATYARSGWWKARIGRRRAGRLALADFGPPGLVLSSAAAAGLGALGGGPVTWIPGGAAAAYLGLLTLAGWTAPGDRAARALAPLPLLCMHLGFGLGFLGGALAPVASGDPPAGGGRERPEDERTPNQASRVSHGS